MLYDAHLSMITGHDIYTQGANIYLVKETNQHLIGSKNASSIKDLKDAIAGYLP